MPPPHLDDDAPAPVGNAAGSSRAASTVSFEADPASGCPGSPHEQGEQEEEEEEEVPAPGFPLLLPTQQQQQPGPSLQEWLASSVPPAAPQPLAASPAARDQGSGSSSLQRLPPAAAAADADDALSGCEVVAGTPSAVSEASSDSGDPPPQPQGDLTLPLTLLPDDASSPLHLLACAALAALFVLRGMEGEQAQRVGR
jgi:hypothetical protein